MLRSRELSDLVTRRPEAVVSQKYLHHQRHLQSIGSTEANQVCTEQEIK